MKPENRIQISQENILAKFCTENDNLYHTAAEIVANIIGDCMDWLGDYPLLHSDYTLRIQHFFIDQYCNFWEYKRMGNYIYFYKTLSRACKMRHILTKDYGMNSTYEYGKTPIGLGKFVDIRYAHLMGLVEGEWDRCFDVCVDLVFEFLKLRQEGNV